MIQDHETHKAFVQREESTSKILVWKIRWKIDCKTERLCWWVSDWV